MPSRTTPSQKRPAGGSKSTPSSSRGKRSASSQKGLDPDLEEEVDKYVDLRNKNMFGKEDDPEDSDEGDEMVLGIGGDDDDEDDDDESDGDDDDNHDVLGSDMEPEDEEEDEEGWGQERSNYYDADEADDSEAEVEEEKEALRLRAKQSESLKAEDFGDDDIASSDGESETLAAAVSKESKSKKGGKESKKDAGKAKESVKAKKKKSDKSLNEDDLTRLDEELEALDDGDHVEKVERDLSGLSEKEKLDILENDAPELLVLLGDFKKYIAEVRSQLMPVKERLKSGGLKTASGVSYLELKLQLLLSYCTNVAFYLLLKSEGRSIKNHPVIEQLVELRTLMEKMRPLDAKLKYQMDKLLKTPLDGTSQATTGDALRFKPNPEALLANGMDAFEDAAADDDDAAAEGGGGGAGRGDGLYRPPRITAMHFEDKEDIRKRKALEKKASKARKSEIVQALREEFDDTPMEQPSIGSAAQYRDEEEDHRTRFEEENFIRVAVNKKERARLAKARRSGGEAFESFEDFGDIDLSVDRDEDKAAMAVLKKRSLHDYIAGQEQDRRARRNKETSGEADVPIRDRHAIIQHVAQRKQALAARAAARGAGEESDGGGSDGSGGGNDTYRAAKAAKVEAKAAKAAKYARAPAEYKAAARVEDGEKREADRSIVKNRGLVPHRSRDKKNPRVKHRIKYDKAQTKERTSLYGKQAREDKAAYAGEATGIKPGISRSRKL